MQPKKDRELKLINLLQTISDNRWEWHVMLPKVEGNKQPEMYAVVSKLISDDKYREEFLKEIVFFQEYTLFADNTELQKLLIKLHKEVRRIN